MNNEIKIKKAVYIVGILITGFILFCLGIFSLVYLAWPHPGNGGKVEVGFVVLCIFLIIILIFQIRGLAKVSKDLKSINGNQENIELDKNSTQIKNNAVPLLILGGGIVVLYFLYTIAHNLGIL